MKLSRRPAANAPGTIYQRLDDDLECPEGYAPGGYHPVTIGEEFCAGRYLIVHKLGFGGYSTVWLAHDRKQSQYVALKFIVASASAKNEESEIYHRLQAGDLNHPGRKFVQRLIDKFTIDGPNGKHLCLVTQAAGCSLRQAKESSTIAPFQREVACAIATQIVMGVAYMHSCGVGHGDLHLGNILLQYSSFQTATPGELYNEIGKPLQESVLRIDQAPLKPGIPPHLIYPAHLSVPAYQLKLRDSRIKIVDFGEAYLIRQPPKTLHTPLPYLPPESLFDEIPGLHADIWTLACTLYYLFGDGPIFELFFGNKDQLLAEMVGMLGILPPRWWKRWEGRTRFFLEDGTRTVGVDGELEPDPRTLQERLQSLRSGFTVDVTQFQSTEIADLYALISNMLLYEPSMRITAEQMLSSTYVRKWGLPLLPSVKLS